MGARSASIFERHPGIFNPDSPEPPPAATNLADSVGRAGQAYREVAANARKTWRLQRDCAREAERLESALCDAEGAEKVARDALIRAIILADPKPMPTIEEWHYCSAPLWKTTVGGKLYFVLQDRSNTTPDREAFDDPSRLVDVVTWGVIDLDAADKGEPPASAPTGDVRVFRDDKPADPILDAVRRLDDLARTHEEWGRLTDWHESEKDRIEGLWIEAEKQAKLARRDVIHLVIEASGLPIPDDNAWFSTSRPIWSVKAGGKLLCCVPNGNYPKDLDDAVDRVKLAIIDLDSIGGVS